MKKTIFKISIVIVSMTNIIMADTISDPLSYTPDNLDYHETTKSNNVDKSSKNKEEVKEKKEETYSSLKVKYTIAMTKFKVCVKVARSKEALEACSDIMIDKIEIKDQNEDSPEQEDNETW